MILPMALEAILKTQNASRETAGRFLILRELVKKIFSLSSCSALSHFGEQLLSILSLSLNYLPCLITENI